MQRTVIVLNSDYSFLNTVTVERAFLYIAKEKVQVEKYAEKYINTSEDVFRIPRIVRFIKMIKQVFKKKIPWSKRNVFIRDNYVCQYCGKKVEKPTVDHILPKSRGGKNSFLNCVASCFSCNNLKDDKTPDEAGMKLLKVPKAPTVNEFIRLWTASISIDDLMKELGYGQ